MYYCKAIFMYEKAKTAVDIMQNVATNIEES